MTNAAPQTDIQEFPVRLYLNRLIATVVAIAFVGMICAMLAWLLWPALPVTPAKTPFGLAREALPSATGIGGYILALQGRFYQAMTGAILALKENDAAVIALLGVGFAYGVFHAAGPGHGKGVISAYLMASERSLKKGLAISLAAALLQALVAIAIVTVAAIVLNATAKRISNWSDTIETASFAIVALLGLLMCWRKAGKFLAILAISRGGTADPVLLACDHVHLPPPEEIDRMRLWRDRLGVIVAAGIRPCSGAIILLVFSLSQGLFAAGIAATFAMAFGTALTTGAIAAIAVFAKAFALRLAGGRSSGFSVVAIAAFELLAAAFIAVLGLSLVSGLWAGSGSG